MYECLHDRRFYIDSTALLLVSQMEIHLFKYMYKLSYLQAFLYKYTFHFKKFHMKASQNLDIN